jgi:hypothetical protein
MPDETPPPDSGFTEAQLAQLTIVVEKVANATFTSRDKQAAKTRQAELKSAFDAFLPELDKVVTTKLEGHVPNPPPGEKPPGGTSVQDSPEWKGMLKKQAELDAKIAAGEARLAAERAKSRDVSLRQKVSEALVKKGIDAARARQALALLKSEDRVKYESDDDDAGITFLDADGTEVDLNTGLDGWVKTDDAKIYMPPRGSAGSGDRGGGRRAAGQQKTEATYEDVGNMVLDSFPSMLNPR